MGSLGRKMRRASQRRPKPIISSMPEKFDYTHPGIFVTVMALYTAADSRVTNYWCRTSMPNLKKASA